MSVYGGMPRANFAKAERRTFPHSALERAYPDALTRSQAEAVLRRNGWDKSYPYLNPKAGLTWYRILGVE